MPRHGTLRTVRFANTATQIAVPDATRCAILFSPPVPVPDADPVPFYTIANLASVADGAGIVIASGTPAVLLTRETVGDIVKQPWYAIAGDTTVLTVGVLETTEDCP